MKINLRSIVTGMVLVLILAGTVLFFQKQKHRQAPAASAKLQAGVDYQLVEKALGPAQAPVQLTEYSDFECPSCRAAQQEVHKIMGAYTGKIRLVFKHYPLTSHRWSIYAHQAAECMNRQGKFWPYQNMLYTKQPDWALSNVPPVEILVRYAKELGANMERFDACMADVSITRAIYAEKEEGNRHQVNATPTFLLGQERFVGPREMQERGENAIRKILGLPLKPVTPQKTETVASLAPLAKSQKGSA